MDDDFIEPISDEELSLSTLSLSGEISYDDISVGSFESDIEIDNLIKRTKQKRTMSQNSYTSSYQNHNSNNTGPDSSILTPLDFYSYPQQKKTLLTESQELKEEDESYKEKVVSFVQSNLKALGELSKNKLSVSTHNRSYEKYEKNVDSFVKANLKAVKMTHRYDSAFFNSIQNDVKSYKKPKSPDKSEKFEKGKKIYGSSDSKSSKIDLKNVENENDFKNSDKPLGLKSWRIPLKRKSNEEIENNTIKKSCSVCEPSTNIVKNSIATTKKENFNHDRKSIMKSKNKSDIEKHKEKPKECKSGTKNSVEQSTQSIKIERPNKSLKLTTSTSVVESNKKSHASIPNKKIITQPKAQNSTQINQDKTSKKTKEKFIECKETNSKGNNKDNEKNSTKNDQLSTKITKTKKKLELIDLILAKRKKSAELKQDKYKRKNRNNILESPRNEAKKSTINKKDIEKSPVKSIVNIVNKFNITKMDYKDDLRVKLNEKLKNNYKDFKERYFKELLKDNIIVSVKSEKIDEHENEHEICHNYKNSDKNQESKIEKKEIELVIKFVNDYHSKTASAKTFTKNTEEVKLPFLSNEDLSFLDDFDVDEVVDCLDKCKNEINMKGPTMNTNFTDSFLVTEGKMIQNINLEEKFKLDYEVNVEDSEQHNKIDMNIDDIERQMAVIFSDSFTDTSVGYEELDIKFAEKEQSNNTSVITSPQKNQLDAGKNMEITFDKDTHKLSSKIQDTNSKIDFDKLATEDEVRRNKNSEETENINLNIKTNPTQVLSKTEGIDHPDESLKIDGSSLNKNSIAVLNPKNTIENKKNISSTKETNIKDLDCVYIIKSEIESEPEIINNINTHKSLIAQETKDQFEDSNKDTNLIEFQINSKTTKSSVFSLEDESTTIISELSNEDTTKTNNTTKPIDVEDQNKKETTLTKENALNSIVINDNNQNLLPSPDTYNLCDVNLIKSIEIRMHSVLQMKYKITSLIKNGKFSTIFRCKDSNSKDYAIKLINRESDRHTLGILKEKILVDLQKDTVRFNCNNEYIIKGFGVSRKWCFLMEYYPNNLKQVLDKNNTPFHIDVVQLFARQLISALLMLKNSNIIHSDIKPEHILVNAQNTKVKLCGFDAAFYGSKNYKIAPNIGTSSYRAPEVILGYNSPSFSIDVWSMALTFYQMSTNITLFPGIYNNDILYKQMCTLGQIPFTMLKFSKYRDFHFSGMTFKRVVVSNSQKKIVLVRTFEKSSRLEKTLSDAYHKYWSAECQKQRSKEINKMHVFHQLLQQMLVPFPKYRLSVEFVSANPFIYQMYEDNI